MFLDFINPARIFLLNRRTVMETKILKCEETYLISARIEDAEIMLREFHPGDNDDLSFFDQPVTLKRQREYLRRIIDSRQDHLFCVMNNGILIGTVGLHECDIINGNARIGALIFNPELRHQGHGTKAIELIVNRAFHEFGLSKVYVNLLADDPSLHAYFQWLRFKRECLLEKEYLLRGEYRDLLRFRLFPEEWKNIFETEQSSD
jgi:RimJ/RimL family protein N-acetyltransferase